MYFSLKERKRSGTFQTRFFLPQKPRVLPKVLGQEWTVHSVKNGDQKSPEKATSKYLPLLMKLLIVHVSTVYFLVFYLLSCYQLPKPWGFTMTFLHMYVTYFGHVHTTLSFLYGLCILYIVSTIWQLYQILYVFMCVHLCTHGGQRSTQNVHNHSPSYFWRQDLPLNLELLNFTRLVGSRVFLSLPPPPRLLRYMPPYLFFVYLFCCLTGC